MVTLPFTFVTDTTIQAPQVNSNFIALRDGVNAIPPGGTQGPPGQAATIDVIATNTTAAGTQANVVQSGTAQARTLTFYIPRGDTGVQGPPGTNGTNGAPGTAATITVGTVTSTAHTNPPTITEAVGSTAQARIYDFVIPQGAPGDPGDITAAVNTAVANAMTALLATLDDRYVRIGS